MAHDLGMLVIRLALGLMLIAHGANKAFGSGGLRGTTAWSLRPGCARHGCTHGSRPAPRSSRERCLPSAS